MIALEGPDNSGKTTLAQELARQLGHQLIHPGGPPATMEDEQNHLDHQFQLVSKPVIFDRLTCISQQVYQNRMWTNPLAEYLTKMLAQECLIIYCRPSNAVLMDMSKTSWKEYDTPEHINKILTNQHKYIEMYDTLMNKTPHLSYDWQTDDITELVRCIKDLDYQEMNAMGLLVPNYTTWMQS